MRLKRSQALREGDGDFGRKEWEFGEEILGDQNWQACGEGFEQGEGEAFEFGGVHESVGGEEVAGDIVGPCDPVDG